MRYPVFATVTTLLIFMNVGWADQKPSVILFDGHVSTVANALVESDELLIPVSDTKSAIGFQVKPMGFCSSERCVPIPKGEDWIVQREGNEYVNVSRFTKRINQPMVGDETRRIWAVGVANDDRPASLELGQAPDFALPNREGKIVRLSDFRGKKVLLLTWASWCGCSLDLVGWQKVYEELSGKNFELIAVAEDTAGEEAAGKFYDRAHATFTTLIDKEHRISQLYQMVNVPTGVWIDEEGKIVRPGEVAYTQGFKILGKTVGDDRYVPGLRDWVEKGNKSEYVMTPAKIRQKAAPRTAELKRAELEFLLGVYLKEQGDSEGAKEHWGIAQKLDPNNWNYHRQDWSFDQKTAMRNWIRKVGGLKGKPYYEPIEFSNQ